MDGILSLFFFLSSSFSLFKVFFLFFLCTFFFSLYKNEILNFQTGEEGREEKKKGKIILVNMCSKNINTSAYYKRYNMALIYNYSHLLVFLFDFIILFMKFVLKILSHEKKNGRMQVSEAFNNFHTFYSCILLLVFIT